MKKFARMSSLLLMSLVLFLSVFSGSASALGVRDVEDPNKPVEEEGMTCKFMLRQGWVCTWDETPSVVEEDDGIEKDIKEYYKDYFEPENPEDLDTVENTILTEAEFERLGPVESTYEAEVEELEFSNIVSASDFESGKEEDYQEFLTQLNVEMEGAELLRLNEDQLLKAGVNLSTLNTTSSITTAIDNFISPNQKVAPGVGGTPSFGGTFSKGKAPKIVTKKGKKHVEHITKSGKKVWSYIINQKWAGKTYKGIEFSKNGFPKFKSMANFVLPENYWKSAVATQKKWLNNYMRTVLNGKTTDQKKQLWNNLTPEEIKLFQLGLQPKTLVWHHHETTGRMQLIRKVDHQKVSHLGGYTIWVK